MTFIIHIHKTQPLINREYTKEKKITTPSLHNTGKATGEKAHQRNNSFKPNLPLQFTLSHIFHPPIICLPRGFSGWRERLRSLTDVVVRGYFDGHAWTKRKREKERNRKIKTHQHSCVTSPAQHKNKWLLIKLRRIFVVQVCSRKTKHQHQVCCD